MHFTVALLLLVCIVAIATYCLFKFLKKSSEVAPIQQEESPEEIDVNDLPEALQEPYKIAINPTSLGKPVLYALVTCQHCIRTQRFLKENKVDYKLIHVDLFEANVRKYIMKILKTFNERGSFPTLVMPSGKTVVGFREHLVREALKNESERTR